MKTKRNLSGVYFRSKNEETGKWDNVCFEDLSGQEQKDLMKDRSAEWLRGLAQHLADTINKIAEHFDLMSE